MRSLNLAGQRFERLIAVELVAQGKKRKWRCRCDCGKEVVVTTHDLRAGSTRSCGCLKRERAAERCRRGFPEARHTTHGHARKAGRHPLYTTWAGMWARCTNKAHAKFPLYGARGITVCERWRDFALFLADMGNRPSPGLTLDRIENDGNYEPKNVRWATPIAQAANRRPRRSSLTEAR